MIDKPGVYEISANEYHSDPVVVPSLSSSLARALIANSPLHCWFESPRLNPNFQREEEEKFDLGTAAHALLLEGESGVQVIDAPDWRTKAAREARDAARAAGKLPLLAARWADVLAMVKSAREQLDAHTEADDMFTEGKAEQTLIWQEDTRDGAIYCRARLDFLHDDHLLIDDYKTTGACANPEAWTRGLFNSGFDIQAAFYLRGVRAIFGTPVIGTRSFFGFAVQENYPPYALSVISLAPDALVIAEKKVLYAIDQWAKCLRANHWPGYPARICYAGLPPWEEAAWLEKETMDGHTI